MKIARTVVAFVAVASAAWCHAADDESSGDGSEVADYRAHDRLGRLPLRLELCEGADERRGLRRRRDRVVRAELHQERRADKA